MSAKDYFNNTLKAKVEEDPDAAEAIGAVFHFKISGDEGGEWTLNCKDDVGLSEGIHGDSDCTISCTDETWDEMAENPGGAMQLFFAGKLKVGGNAMLATKLQNLLK